MSTEDEVRRLCAALWPGLSVAASPETRSAMVKGRRRPVQVVVAYSVAVGRSMMAPGTEVGRSATAAEAWADALAGLPQRMAERVAEIDREVAAMAEERARIAAALSSLDGGAT